MLNFLLLFIILCVNVFYILVVRKHVPFTEIDKLFVSYWTINIVLGLLFFSNEYSWHFLGLVYLLFCVDIYAFTFVLFSTSKKSIPKLKFLKLENRKATIHFLLLFCTLCGFAYVYMELTTNGFDFSVFLSYQSLIDSGYYFSDGRYGDTELSVPIIGQIFLATCYSGFVLSGYAYKLKVLKKEYSFIIFLPMILTVLSTTAKTGLISGVFLWTSGYLVASTYTFVRQNKRKFNSIPLKTILYVTVSFVGLFFASFAIRYNSSASDNLAIFNRIFVYTLGHVPCYDDWFNKFPINLWGYSYGQQSMQFIFGSKMPQALKVVYNPSSLDTQYGWTNVGTMFEYVLMDFGYIGSIFFFAILGFLSSLCKKNLCTHENPLFHSLLGLSYYIVLYSFLICPLKYTTIVVAFFLFGLYLHVLFALKCFKK